MLDSSKTSRDFLSFITQQSHMYLQFFANLQGRMEFGSPSSSFQDINWTTTENIAKGEEKCKAVAFDVL